MSTRYNIRVYGILINDRGEVLVSDERRNGISFTKFPGGGLEWGEGLHEALIRELQEELGVACSVGALLYVNEFFQQSAFREEDQLISFYFEAFPHTWDAVPATEHIWPLMEEGELFRWVSLSVLDASSFTFPIDKRVAALLADSQSE